jgi:6-pyruvoyltetrahydropterin/6-carboxytetrahydropterin synthase
MIRLSREVRFALNADYDARITNSWSGWPATLNVVPHLVLTCTAAGEMDGQTGYLCNIKVLDDLMRGVITDTIIPKFGVQLRADELLGEIYRHCQLRWQSNIPIVEQSLALTPQLKFTIRSENEQMIELTQQFEFSAAHRLHCNDLTDEENRKLFGKCNNPEGHGHNYVVEVCIAGESVDGRPIIELARFESIVKELVIDRLDHKHLNRDVSYFARINPSVENIAIAIWNWLEGQFGTAHLSNIRVYETPKTWADYSGNNQGSL